MMGRTYHELMRKKQNLEEALMNINAALESDTYTKPFKHTVENQIRPEEVEHQVLKNILSDCNNRKLGFDPELLLQHIEKEVHEQYNKVVESHIKDRPIEFLLQAKHEMELFMLKERAANYPKSLEKINAELKAIDEALSDDPHAELPISPTIEQKVEAVQVLEASNPEVLTDKEIKKVLKVPTKKKVTTKRKK